MIDWSQLDTLEAEMGDSFPEIVELFLEEASEIVERLKAADPHDGAALAADLHALKGAALNLGLTGLATLSGEGEERAAAGQTGEIALPALFACFFDSCSALEKRSVRGAA